MNIQNLKQANIRQGGFTLIELVIVIVILGILAAVAVPRFIDLSDEAEQAAVDGIAGAMASGMAINYAGCSAKGHDPATDECVAVANCTDAKTTLAGGTGAAADYSITAAALGSNGATADCTVTKTGTSFTATFQGIGAGQ